MNCISCYKRTRANYPFCPHCRTKRIIERIYIEGNKGGDYLEIIHEGDETNNMIKLRVGHCCVPTIEKTIPIEILTYALTHVLGMYHDSFENLIETSGWSDTFITKLQGMVQE